jgi:hypothetical protein
LSTNDFLVLSIIQMTIDDLLRQGERTVQSVKGGVGGLR